MVMTLATVHFLTIMPDECNLWVILQKTLFSCSDAPSLTPAMKLYKGLLKHSGMKQHSCC